MERYHITAAMLGIFQFYKRSSLRYEITQADANTLITFNSIRDLLTDRIVFRGSFPKSFQFYKRSSEKRH